MDLLINSYNLRQSNLFKKSLTHPVIISIEKATISFICDVFKDLKTEKQYRVNNYFIDLYFVDYKIAIECDEDHHLDKTNIKLDVIRQNCIEDKLNCTFYRYKRNDDNFTLSKVIRELMILICDKM